MSIEERIHHYVPEREEKFFHDSLKKLPRHEKQTLISLLKRCNQENRVMLPSLNDDIKKLCNKEILSVYSIKKRNYSIAVLPNHPQLSRVMKRYFQLIEK